MSWERFYQYVLPSVPTCPEPTADHQIRLAAMEFCDRTHVWTETLDSIEIDGSASYALNFDQDAEIATLVSVRVGDDDYTLVSRSDAKRMIQRGEAARIAWTDNRQDVFLHPIPQDGELIVEVALKPSLAAEDFPDDVFAHHAEDIAHGALARLHALPKQDWTDLVEAQRRRSLFDEAIASAGIQASKGYGNATMRVRAHFF